MGRLVTVTLLLIGLLHSVPKQADQAKANQNGANKSIQSVAAPEQRATARPCPEVEKNSSKNQPKEPGYWKLFLLALLNNWPLMIVAVWGIIVARRTLRSIDKQTKATADSAKAAQRSIELQELAFQQWVDLSRWRISLAGEIPEGYSVNVSFELSNKTKFPLTLSEVRVVFAREETSVPCNNVLAPEGSFPIHARTKVSREAASGYLDRTSALALQTSGKVVFIDVLRTQTSQPFEGVLFCFRGRASFTGGQPAQENTDQNPN